MERDVEKKCVQLMSKLACTTESLVYSIRVDYVLL